MNQAQIILSEVRKKTENIILFSSVLGKDSTILTHFCSEIFKQVFCVYMYLVKDLEHVKKLQRYYTSRYGNIVFIDLPSYVLSGYLKVGYLGLAKHPKQKIYNLADIDRIARDRTGVSYSIYGMKKSDSMNRRLQLNTYPDGICHESNKVYPLMDFSNKQILSLIDLYRLPKPISFAQGQSSGEDVGNGAYLLWLYNNHPADCERTIKAFPGCKIILFEALEEEENGNKESGN